MKLQNKLLIWLFTLSMAIGMLTKPLSAAAADMDDNISETISKSTHELLGYAVPIAEPEQPATIASSALLYTSDQQIAYERMIAKKSKYPEGMTWTNDNFYAWKGGIYSGGYGCAGFAFLLSDAAFGDAPARMIKDVKFSEVRVGDILRINDNTHSVIVLEVNSDSVTLAEGNFNSSIHWGRTLSASAVEAADYLMTRYGDEYDPDAITLSIKTYPKQSYYVGEKLDLSGGELSVKKVNGTEEFTLPMTDSAVTVGSSKFKSNTPGTYTIKLTYQNASVSFTVTVAVDPDNAPVILSGQHRAEGSGEGTTDGNDYFLTLSDAFKAIGKDTGDFVITVTTALSPEKGLTFPSKANSITINDDSGEGIIRTSAVTLSPNCNLTLNCRIENTNNKLITLKPAANTTLTIQKASDCISAITGKKTTKLIIDTDLTITRAATLAQLTVTEDHVLTFRDNGKLLSIASVSGKILLPATAAATLSKVDNAQFILTQQTSANGVTLPKVTVTSIEHSLQISVINTNGQTVNLASGTTVLYAKNAPDSISDNIVIANTDGEKTLKLFLYNKEIRAEVPDALWLNDQECPSFEKAFQIIKNNATTTPQAEYTIRMNTDISVKKWAFPTKAGSLTIDGQGHSLTLTGITSLTPKYDLTLKNVSLTATTAKSAPAAFTLKAAKNLTVDRLTVNAKSFRLTGSAKYVLSLGDCSEINTLSGFGTVNLSGETQMQKKCSVTNLSIDSSALLTILPSCAMTIKNLSCTEGSRICLVKGFKPIALTVSATGKAALVSEDGIPEGTQIFRSKLTNLNEVFSVTGLIPAASSQSYTLSLEKGKVYLRNQKAGSL